MITPHSSMLRILAPLAVALSAVCAAQGAPRTPTTPNLLGVYPGMTQLAARTMLQKQSDTEQVKLNDVGYPSLSLSIRGKNPEQLNAFLTMDPDNPTVWMVQQTQNFEDHNPMSQEALMSALRGKYGQETATRPQAGWLYVYWIFDASGKLMTSTNPALTHCDGTGYVTYINHLPRLNDGQKACYQGFFGVVAALNRQGALLAGYDVQLVNLPYAYQAALAATNAGNQAADKAAQATLKKADKNKPVF